VPWRAAGIRALSSIFAVAAIGCATLLWHVSRTTDGLLCHDFPSADWSGPPSSPRTISALDAASVLTSEALAGRPFSTECRGWLYADASDDYTFLVGADDGATLVIDGKVVVNNGGRHGMQYLSSDVMLPAGAREMTLRYTQNSGESGLVVLVSRGASPPQPIAANRLSRVARGRMDVLRADWSNALIVLLTLVAVTLLAATWRAPILALGPMLRGAVERFHTTLAAPGPRSYCLLAAIAIVVRVIVALCSYALVWPDSFSYYDTATGMLHGDWLRHEIFRTPLYPAFMAAIFSGGATPGAAEGVILAQHGLGVVATLLVFDLGRRTIGTVPAFYAALLWTMSPLTLFYETSVATESLFAALVLVVLWLSTRCITTDASVAALTALGIACAAATLTRPVGKALVVVIASLLVWWAPRARLKTALVPMLVFAALIVPWMWVNHVTYGFFGISRGEGLGLYMRAFDIEHLPAPMATSFPLVLDAHQRLSGKKAYLHYPVREDLNYGQRLSALETDLEMEGFALEAITAHPVIYVSGIAHDWAALFVAPHQSVRTCPSTTGTNLCTTRTDYVPLGPFANTPTRGFLALKEWTAGYMNRAYPVLMLFGPLAVVGTALLVRTRHHTLTRARIALLVATVVYFATISVMFNTIEDRYRLPVDAFVMILACGGIATAFDLRRRPGRNAQRFSEGDSLRAA
jgi:4-amino-4-deoxy-L-arabinose transferase-like glycosyltransferase